MSTTILAAKLAAKAVSLLSPYFAEMAKGAAGAIGELGVKKGALLLSKLSSRWGDKPDEREVLKKFADDTATGSAGLQMVLAAELAADSNFRESFQAIIDGKSPELLQEQVVHDAVYVKGPEILRLLKGEAIQRQTVVSAHTVIGPTVSTVGGGTVGG